MDANYIQIGESLDYTNGTGSKIDAGDIVVIGTKIGVAGCDIPVGAKGSLHVEGVFEFPEKSGESAINMGAAVYYDATAGAITATSTSNTLAGYAAAPAGASATKILVKINA